MYTVTWHRYPHGIEGEEMDCNWREFDDIEKAIRFLHGRVKLIKSVNWAGGYIEDENCKELYAIYDSGESEDLRSGTELKGR